MHREFGEKKLLLSTGMGLGEQVGKLTLRGNIVRDKSTLKMLVTKEETSTPICLESECLTGFNVI